VHWLLHSGIRVPDGPLAGAFRAWRDGTWGWAFSEVTGYGITLLCGLAREGMPGALDAAVASGRWLLDDARVGPAFRCRNSAGVWLGHLCAFDNGMIVLALCNLYRLTGDRLWLNAATSTADWLARRMDGDGALLPKHDLATDGPVPGTRWSSRPGPYQAKVALGLFQVATLAGRPDLATTARRLVRRAARFQQPDGRFVTDEVLGDTYLHAHCYTIEGLLGAGFLNGSPDLAMPAEAALRWLPTVRTPTGGVSRRFDGQAPEPVEHVDSTAQTLRLLRLTGRHPDWVAPLTERLLAFQCDEGDPARDGGFRYALGGDAASFENVTAHGTMFAVQALDLCLGDPATFDWTLLV
jgi:hypothetical protein